MYTPTRAGARGGQGEFRWDNVKADQHRENYLGHSINAPQGRWQNRKDIHWYSREDDVGVDALERAARERREEIKKIKEQEEDALSVALGFGPVVRDQEGEGTGANGVVVKKSEKELEVERLEAEEKKARKALKKEQKELKAMQKSVRKEIRHAEKEKRSSHSHRHRDRSASPYARRDRSRSRERSRSPERGGRKGRDYSEDSRERREERGGGKGKGREEDGGRGDSRDRGGEKDTHHGNSKPDAARSEPYDPEKERASQRRRWEREHDRERGDGSGWGR